MAELVPREGNERLEWQSLGDTFLEKCDGTPCCRESLRLIDPTFLPSPPPALNLGSASLSSGNPAINSIGELSTVREGEAADRSSGHTE